MKQRIAPSNATHWSDETRAILGSATPAAESESGEGPPNILYTIAHHPSLLPPFLAFAATLASRGVLPRREAELLALRAAWNCRSAFEWGHHVEYGLAAGLTPEQVRRVAIEPEHPDWSAKERLLLQTADELHAHQQIDDRTFAGLRQLWSDAQIVEICFVVGNYTMLSMVANATSVALEARLAEMPEAPGT